MGGVFRQAVLKYLSGAFVYGIALLFYRSNRYYVEFLSPQTRDLLLYIYVGYLLFSPVVLLFSRHRRLDEHRPWVFLALLRRQAVGFVAYLREVGRNHEARMPPLSTFEKTTLLFMGVKLFFVPMMFNFLLGHVGDFRGFGQVFSMPLSLEFFTYWGYSLALASIFLVDTLFFSLGYVFEADFLKNRVRSVEPTAFGWMVALACYPPFNSVLERYVGWWPSDGIQFPSLALTFAARLAIVILLAVYLWATISLFTKCSNLTNRGIITTGAYAVIRHPAYVSKVASWWIMIIPVMGLAAFISMLVWSVVYFFRAVTEEQHLMSDPDYRAYCEKTKYRFIPFIA
ncbi:DUF1295 domain-containing protein [Candidatus Woesearchaeota archaeon]|nr:DUF1295 domain-containing protein [Candidatus Woesearchaeota archaeon]